MAQVHFEEGEGGQEAVRGGVRRLADTPSDLTLPLDTLQLAGCLSHQPDRHMLTHMCAAAATAAAGKRGPLTQQLQVLYAALVEADVAAGREAAWDDDDGQHNHS